MHEGSAMRLLDKWESGAGSAGSQESRLTFSPAWLGLAVSVGARAPTDAVRLPFPARTGNRLLSHQTLLSSPHPFLHATMSCRSSTLSGTREHQALPCPSARRATPLGSQAPPCSKEAGQGI